MKRPCMDRCCNPPADDAGWYGHLALAAMVLIFAVVAPMLGNPIGWFWL